MEDRWIVFDNLRNFRDLGGLSAMDGSRIIRGRLIRGGNLNGASAFDLDKLGSMLELVADFRTEGEILEKPDPEIPGVRNWHLPLLQTITEGVSREKDADQNAFMRFVADPEQALAYMVKTYEHLAGSVFAQEQLKKLLQYLPGSGEKGVLWHCTAGKDRTGIFALILEEILGVSRDDIIEDYLLTNQGNREAIERMVLHFSTGTEVDPEKAVPAIQSMFGAREEYVLAFYRETERLYGSFELFLEKALGADREMRSRFRNLYLV